VSESLRREALAWGLEPAKARVIRPAVNPDAFRPGGRNGHEELRLVMVSELRWEKGYEYALQAVRELIEADVPVRLELMGDGPPANESERRRIVHTVSDLGLDRHVELTGAVRPAEVSRRLAAADVLVQASLAEGIPNSVLEAMACGRPVVTTDVGGVVEAVRDGVEGLVVTPREPGAMAGALRRLWREPDLRERMGAAGRERIRAAFTLERQLEDFQALYSELATRP
jgi:glycosyltransferase involved in cell wall biosynthesis